MEHQMTYSGQLYFPCKHSQFSLVGGNTHSTAVYTDTQFGVNIFKLNNNGNNELASMLVRVPNTPYSVITKLVCNGFNLDNLAGTNAAEVSGGMCFANGAATTSKLKLFKLRWGSLNGGLAGGSNPTDTALLNLFGFAAGDQYSNYTTESGGGSGTEHCPPTMGMSFIWMRLQNDGTNCAYSISCDGITWQMMYSEPRATYFVASYVGVFVNPYGNDANMTVQSFQVIGA
jgi:hypothetical protein